MISQSLEILSAKSGLEMYDLPKETPSAIFSSMIYLASFTSIASLAIKIPLNNSLVVLNISGTYLEAMGLPRVSIYLPSYYFTTSKAPCLFISKNEIYLFSNSGKIYSNNLIGSVSHISYILPVGPILTDTLSLG